MLVTGAAGRWRARHASALGRGGPSLSRRARLSPASASSLRAAGEGGISSALTSSRRIGSRSSVFGSAGAGSARARRAPRRWPPLPPRRGLSVAGFGLGLGRLGLAVALADGAEQRADGDGLARLHRDLRQHAGGGRRHLDRHLVGLELDQGLGGGDRVAGLLEPLADRRLDDRTLPRSAPGSQSPWLVASMASA